MADGHYDHEWMKHVAAMGEEAPELGRKFYDWYSSVFAEGARCTRDLRTASQSIRCCQSMET